MKDLIVNFFFQNIKNIKIIVIIDESHYGKTLKAEKILNSFNPQIIIRVSATPKQFTSKFDKTIFVRQREVVKVKLIKKEYIINQNLEKKQKYILDESIGDNAILLNEALEKQKYLKNLYDLEGSIVNPLIIIQLPDEKSERETKIKEDTITFLKKKDITIDNKLLAIDLDKKKEI